MITLTRNGNHLHLRETLFWDVDHQKIDPDHSRRLIIERVITRGNLEEFLELKDFYSRKELTDSVMKIGYLDNRSLNFISKFLNISKKEFKCYLKRQSAHPHWNS